MSTFQTTSVPSGSQRASGRGWLRLAAVLLALSGCGVSLVLVRMKSPGAEGGSLGSSFCTPSARVNCDYVLSSPWAKIGPFPSALVGAAYFAAVGVWFAAVGPANRKGRVWHLVPLVAGAMGLVGSIWFVYVMTVRLPVWCTWCAAAHIINALMFGVILATWPGGKSAAGEVETARPTTQWALTVLLGAGAAIIIVVLYVFSFQHQSAALLFRRQLLEATNNADYIAWRHRESPLREIPLSPDELIFGEANAPQTVVVFSDFECVNCFEFHRYVFWLNKAFPGMVRYVMKHYPMDRACNSHVPEAFHVSACDAARAATAAQVVGTIPQALSYQALLFANRGSLVLRPYERLAGDVGIDADALARAMASPEVEKKVQADIRLAHELGVEGTPTIYLNGRHLESWRIQPLDGRGGVDIALTNELWSKLLGAAPASSQPVR